MGRSGLLRLFGGRRANPDVEPLEVRAAEHGGGVSHDPRRQKTQSRAPGRGIDDDHDGIPFDRGDPQAFRTGQVQVAFEGVLTAPELVRLPCQCSENGRIIGDDGSDRPPRAGAFATRHGLHTGGRPYAG